MYNLFEIPQLYMAAQFIYLIGHIIKIPAVLMTTARIVVIYGYYGNIHEQPLSALSTMKHGH